MSVAPASAVKEAEIREDFDKSEALREPGACAYTPYNYAWLDEEEDTCEKLSFGVFHFFHFFVAHPQISRF